MTTAEILVEAYGRIQQLVHQSVSGIETDDLVFRPEADANSIAWLLWHLTRTQDDHVSEIAARDQIWTSGEWVGRDRLPDDPAATGFGYTSEQVAAVRPTSAAVLTGYHDAVFGATVEYLNTIDASELDRVIDRSYDPPVTVGVRLVSVLSDNLQHAGQARYVNGIVKQQR